MSRPVLSGNFLKPCRKSILGQRVAIPTAAVPGKQWSHRANRIHRRRAIQLPPCASMEMAMLVKPLAHSFHAVADTYNIALQHYPLPTKAATSAITYGIGDLMAQNAHSRRTGSRNDPDLVRLRNFMLSGAGGGILWAWWYDFLDTHLREAGIEPGVASTTISIFLEQFAWAPIFFGFYFLPLNSFMKWGSPEKIVNEVKEEIGPVLWANAKVWTLLNIIIYNAPLPIRVLVSNSGDLLWTAYLSFFVQETCSDNDEFCIPEKEDVLVFLQEEAMPVDVSTMLEPSIKPQSASEQVAAGSASSVGLQKELVSAGLNMGANGSVKEKT